MSEYRVYYRNKAEEENADDFYYDSFKADSDEEAEGVAASFLAGEGAEEIEEATLVFMCAEPRRLLDEKRLLSRAVGMGEGKGKKREPDGEKSAEAAISGLLVDFLKRTMGSELEKLSPQKGDFIVWRTGGCYSRRELEFGVQVIEQKYPEMFVMVLPSSEKIELMPFDEMTYFIEELRKVAEMLRRKGSEVASREKYERETSRPKRIEIQLQYESTEANDAVSTSEGDLSPKYIPIREIVTVQRMDMDRGAVFPLEVNASNDADAEE